MTWAFLTPPSSGPWPCFTPWLHRRFTEDADLLVTRDSLRLIHEKLDGLGYLPLFPASKNLRDTESGVKIEFLITGDYPGDGKPKPVAFPDPIRAGVEQDGVRYINLPTLIELKLASGMTNPARLKDLADVLELIKALNLKKDLTEQLDPSVRAKYLELWQQGRKRFVTLWRNKWLTAEAQSIDDMIASMRDAADTLQAMKDAGVYLDPQGGTSDDYAHLVTDDPEVAKRFDMHEEEEFRDEDQDQEDAAP